MQSKLTSRKFWICVAAFLGSVAASISGLVTDNKYIMTVGIVAGILSAAIYSFCEAWVDSKSATQKSVSVSKHSANYGDIYPAEGEDKDGDEL